MKLLSKLLFAFLICFGACRSKMELRQYDLSIIVAEPLKSTTLPADLVSLSKPIDVADSIFLNSNTGGTSPALYSAYNSKVHQVLYAKTDDVVSEIFKANNNQARITRQIESNLSSLKLDPAFAKVKIGPESKKVIDSLLAESRSKSKFLLILGKNSTDTAYEGYRVYHSVDSLRRGIASAFSHAPEPNGVTILYGLDISLLKKATAPIIKTVAIASPPKIPAAPVHTRPLKQKPQRIRPGSGIKHHHPIVRPPVVSRPKPDKSILDNVTDEEARSRKVTKKDLEQKAKNQ